MVSFHLNCQLILVVSLPFLFYRVLLIQYQGFILQYLYNSKNLSNFILDNIIKSITNLELICYNC